MNDQYSFAQILGQVVDNQSKPVIGARVLLLDSIKNEIASSRTSEKGTFIIAASPGTYEVKIYALGFQIWTADSLLLTKEPFNLGKIILTEQVYNIKEVEIKGSKQLFTQDLDKYIYSVQDDPDSKLSKAMDMLYKIPVVDMQGDRNIKVNGQRVSILVNGKPSILFKGNLETALKSMPADMLQRIEVMTNLSAKYADQSVGAIINLVTKKKQFEGYTIYLGGYTTSLRNHVGTASATLKIGKFAYAGEYTYWWQKPPTTTFSILRPNWKTAGYANGKGIYTNGYNSFSYEVDSLNLFNLSIGLNHASDRTLSFENNFQEQNTLSLNQDNFSRQILKAFSPSLSADYQHNFKGNTNRMYTLSYRLDNDEGRDSSFFDRRDLVASNFHAEKALKFTKFWEQTLQFDFTYPFADSGIWEWGLKSIWRKSDNENTYNMISSTNPLDGLVDLRNDFNYNQTVSSAYQSWANKLGSWSIKGGLRLEYTQDNNNFSFNGSSMNRAYYNWLPSFFISRKISPQVTWSMSYAKRIMRPGIYYLNPYVDFRNPFHLKIGNPNLKPEKLHTIEFNLNKSGKTYLRSSFYYRLFERGIEAITLFEDAIATTSFENIGERHVFGGRLSADKRFGNWSSSIRFNLNYSEFKNLGNKNHISGLTANPEFRVNYTKRNAYRWSIQGGYNSSNPTAQGFTKGQFYNFMLFGKDFMKNKLALSLSGRNLFLGRLKTRNSIQMEDFIQYSFSNSVQQEYKINLSYSFGKLKESVKNTDKTISNDDLRNIKMSEVKPIN